MVHVWLLALVGAVVLRLAYFPWAWGWLGFVGLVPWLGLVVSRVSWWQRYGAGYLGAVVLSAWAMQWVRVAHPLMYWAWLGFALVLPVFWVGVIAGVRFLWVRGVPLAVGAPLVLVVWDYIRMHFPMGFPFLGALGWQQRIGFGWYFLGYTQQDFLAFIQVADVGGIYGVTALVAAVNGMVADWLYRSGWWMRRWGEETGRAPVRCLGCVSAGVLLLVGLNLAYGYYRLQEGEWEAGPQVAALQGVIPQEEKNERGESLVQSYRRLHDEALRQEPRPELIIWPETCCPVDYCEVAAGEKPSAEFALYAQRSREILQRFDPRVPTLLGLNALRWEQGREWKYNSALLLLPGTERFGPRYDKMHLVPFGEYIPFGETLPFLRRFSPYPYEYSCRAGEQWTRFRFADRQGRSWSFGCLICYEDTDPDLARQYVAEEPVDFLVNISNDGWFQGTEEHEEHLAICRFRAIECRRSVVRAVNMGISAVIAPQGRVIALPAAEWSQSKGVEAIVSAVVPIDRRAALYPQIGDSLVGVSALVWLTAGLVLRRRG